MDDYANYRRNVLVTARNQRKGWLKQRGWTRRYFSPLFLSLSLDHHPLALRPLSGWRGRKRPGRESNTSLSLVEERERKRERDEIISPLTGIIPPTWINGEKKGGRNELLSSLGKRTRVCPTRVLKSRIVCTRREIIRANIVKISGGTRNKHGEREGGRTGGQEDNRSNKEKVSFLF